jgi:uncharacterized protein (TIGR02757 family)
MNTLKRKLDYHYKYFNRSKISPDPLEFLHKYSHPCDIEITGLVSSVVAYGNVNQIINTLNRINEAINWQPYNFVMNYSYHKDARIFEDIKHRFYTAGDIALLFYILHNVYTSYSDGLKELFLLYYFEDDENIKNSLSKFSCNLLSLLSHSKFGGEVSPGVQFMFPDPLSGSACKRMNLFLRWMVRNDELDFGLWSEVSKSKLVIPVDTHVAKICKEIGLTKQKVVSWKMAEEITTNLRKFDSKDPVKYDFAICHIGMRKMEF